ncbi:hypothetical protein NUV79_24940 [Bosea sp. 47.2.35]|nr:hypothetical protein [Bosea sp. 47.2.35]MCR4524712.1 hypothetical protein [Bosea sp. 47.2.35]
MQFGQAETVPQAIDEDGGDVIFEGASCQASNSPEAGFALPRGRPHRFKVHELSRLQFRRGEGRNPSLEIFCEDERLPAVLAGFQFARLQQPIDFAPAHSSLGRYVIERESNGVHVDFSEPIIRRSASCQDAS